MFIHHINSSQKELKNVKYRNTVEKDNRLWSFMKIEAYNLIEYAAVANLDADMIFMRNADELFLLPPGSHADGKVSVFNAGMFVIRPSLKIKNDLFNVFSKRCGAFKVFLLSKVVFSSVFL